MSLVIAVSVSMLQSFIFCMHVCCLILMLTCFILTCLLTNIVSVKCMCARMYGYLYICMYVINHFSMKSETYATDIRKILQVYGGETRNGTQVFASVKHIGDGMVGIKKYLAI